MKKNLRGIFGPSQNSLLDIYAYSSDGKTILSLLSSSYVEIRPTQISI